MAEVKAEAEKKSVQRVIWEYTQSIAIALILAMIIRAFVVQAFKIPSGSMIPMNTVIWHRADPKRFDVVVFRYPIDPSKDFIKRVIGLPGDKIFIRNKRVYVNNKELHEPYVQHTDPRIFPPEVSPRDNMGPIVVPAHSLFVMGDNRDESYDSRFWKFVDFSALKGKAFIIYWSWNSHGTMSLDPNHFFIRWNRIGRLIH